MVKIAPGRHQIRHFANQIPERCARANSRGRDPGSAIAVTQLEGRVRLAKIEAPTSRSLPSFFRAALGGLPLRLPSS